VKRMTSLPARTLGLAGRGTIAAESFADLVVFDPVRVIDRATFDQPTAPSEGIELVMVNGRVVRQGGRTTPARPGRVLRPAAA
jgi:N-acyl-D-amino-acid deacylase